MAVKKSIGANHDLKLSSKKHLRTSIGNSINSRPTNKHKRRDFKKYRGQGK